MSDNPTLLEQDRKHLIHPLHHPSAHANPIIIESGQGVWIRDKNGKEYIDGLSSLWNVQVGHGNQELADAAHQQMGQLAYFSNYAGTANEPAIELANKLAGMAYPSLNTTFFTSGGAESNESAFKTARFYWKRMGKPNKYKVIARMQGYHGVTLAAMSATGLPIYWPMFEPRVPGFLHVPAPNSYRFDGDVRDNETIGQAAARAIEEMIIKEGPDTVAAIIAEPIQGAGGVIIPPDDYFPRVREICDEHDVLLIADEVITGFGRTGEWFGLNRWNVQPDIMAFAKGITSGYLPLGGIQVSDKIWDAILNAPADEKWAHAYTYSGHPTCAAVALKNLEIMERENLVTQSKEMGERLLKGLESLTTFPNVGEVRGLGLMCRIEFVADKVSKAPAGTGAKIRSVMQEKGLITRAVGDVIVFAPPLVINEEEVDKIVEIVRDSVEEVS
ncbi:MAG: aspartate aminotransferase family protein [Chloroflexota bacterium]